MKEQEKYCSQCKHMMYHDWYNCTVENFKADTEEEAKEKIKEQKGLDFDDYWGFIRIHDIERHKNCLYFELHAEEE
jgi:hypothetical protein